MRGALLVLSLQRHVFPLSLHSTANLFVMFQLECALKIIGCHHTLIGSLGVNSKGKAVKVPHTLNKATGKDSGSQTAFSVTNFSSATRNYMKSINRLEESVVQDLWGCTKALAAMRGRGALVVLDDDSDDEHALIF